MKVTLVTGAANGIGLAVARHLSKAGHQLALVDRDAEKLLKVAADLTGTRVRWYPGDVTDAERVSEIVDAAMADFGRIDGLVTASGIVKVRPSFDVPPQEFRSQIEVNVTGTWFYAQAVGRQMAQQRAGSIVMIGSVYGFAGAPDRAAYCASKGAVHNLVQALAVEWGPLGIRVNAVAPTGVRTPMVQELIDSGQYNLAGVKARAPLGRLAEAVEVAEACAFLLSDNSRMTTGDVLRVDGGWVANGYTVSN
ncbi:SDR family NAD(P)-dependent oxidoreductase [Solirhodobacter olei]|uniref:SDR family NAD(P)-dependent oxidoreductase n=1 Tax=Solirhodobacter olei TaxID=2493082 RepID=UPI000FDA77E8|nr:SDR family oxidoreductase [Solirhodobacter olei]